MGVGQEVAVELGASRVVMMVRMWRGPRSGTPLDSWAGSDVYKGRGDGRGRGEVMERKEGGDGEGGGR